MTQAPPVIVKIPTDSPQLARGSRSARPASRAKNARPQARAKALASGTGRAATRVRSRRSPPSLEEALTRRFGVEWIARDDGHG